MVVIRAEQPGDAAVIHAIHEASFPTRAEAQLVDALRAAGRLSVSLVAEEVGAVVGHVAFSAVSAHALTAGAGLAPIAVAPAHRGRGVGARLIRVGLAACGRSGFGFVVVLGDPAYYARFGFRPAAGWGMVDPYGGGLAFQALELQAGAIPNDVGPVRYAPEFAALDAR